MAVALVSLSLTAWTELAADVTTVRAIQNAVLHRKGAKLELAVAASLPAASVIGIVLDPQETMVAERIQADLGASGALYGKAINANAEARVST